MKWLLINSNSRYESYELWNSKEKLLSVSYYPEKGSIRIHTHNEKRVFLIRKQGFLRSRTVMRNEYGIRMGQLNSDGNLENQGTITLSDQQFTFNIQRTSAAIHKNSEMLLSCELPPLSGNNDVLMLTLCWYISSGIKATAEQYA